MGRPVFEHAGHFNSTFPFAATSSHSINDSSVSCRVTHGANPTSASVPRSITNEFAGEAHINADVLLCVLSCRLPGYSLAIQSGRSLIGAAFLRPWPFVRGVIGRFSLLRTYPR